MDDKTALLFGPYKPPAVKVRDRAWCLFRNREVTVYDWSIGPIPWPLCYFAGTRAAGKGFLVEDELARAIHHESALAVAHWWGTCYGTVIKWRAGLGVKRMDAEGSRRIIHDAALTNLNGRRKHSPRKVRIWTDEELLWLETLPEEEVAERTGRTLKAVQTMRRLLDTAEVRQ